MSKTYPGGLITKTPVTPAGPYETGAASGVWTLDQQAAYAKQGIWPIAGNVPPYIEDVFSTYLNTPTTSNTAYSINNGIDVSGKGGMVWMKSRSASGNNLLYDTARGASAGSNNALISNNTSGQQTANFDYITGLSNGFTVNFATGGGQLTNNGINYVSWTFREQPKFFDIVTYTGTGANRTIAHSLGSVPGMIIVKRTDTTADWAVYHRSLANTQYIVLNSTAAVATGATRWNSTTPTSSVFSVGTDATVNASGGTYVAYIYAHDAGGFGLTGTDNVISCGSYTTNGSGFANITLGYEPQWVLIKRTDNTGDWELLDIMRGFTDTSLNRLFANNSGAEEVSVGNYRTPTATGFYVNTFASATYIYIACRRGPMKVPTDATKVFSPNVSSTANSVNTIGFRPDSQIWAVRNGIYRNSLVVDRLRGVGTNGSTNDGAFLSTSLTDAEFAAGSNTSKSWDNTSFVTPGYAGNTPEIFWTFQRAPGFFDEVCYTGTGVARTVTHNLGVVPELMIVKVRDIANSWMVYTQALGATKELVLDGTGAFQTSNRCWNDVAPTSTVFTVGTYQGTNGSGNTYVAYLFATCPGVSKVGSYTGNGTTQTINCGFTGGARFVLIKRTDSTGDWYVYDTARGMTVLTDPYLLLNSSAAETATLGSVTTVSTGFALNSAILAAINVSAGTYIFLAIA